MNKALKAVLAILLVVGVLVIAGLANGKKLVETITPEDYESISSSSGFVYYGNSENMDSVKEVAKNYNLKIGFLDSNKNENENLKKGTLYEYKDGKEVYKYKGDFNSYKFVESLVEYGISIKSHVTVSLKEYKEIKKAKGYHLMFIGRETCGYCTQFKESIKQALQKYNFIVYYIDTDTFESQDEFDELIATDKYMSENEWGTPLSLLYKDGKRINVINGYISADELVEFLKENKVVD